jgi:hypothetical protein
VRTLIRNVMSDAAAPSAPAEVIPTNQSEGEADSETALPVAASCGSDPARTETDPTDQQPQPQPQPQTQTQTQTQVQPSGIVFADAVRLLSNRTACDHVHSVREFFEGAPLTAEQLAAAAAAFPAFEAPAEAAVRGWGPLRLLVHLLQLQEARVRAYTAFDAAFGKLLETRNFTPYRLACQRVTLRFAELSNGVRLVRECLRGNGGNSGGDSNDGTGHDALCDLITQLQVAEKRKLETTAQLQVLRQHLTLRREKAAARNHSRENGGGGGGGEGGGDADQDGNDHDHHHHSHGHAHDYDDVPERATLADLAEAVQQHSAALADIVDEINDVVEELRSERADLAE